MNNNKTENINGTESSVNGVSKEESKWETSEIIGVVILIILCCVVPIFAIFFVIILLIVFSQNNNTNIFGGISKFAGFASKASRSSSNISVNPIKIISESATFSKNECISAISETVGETVKRRGYSEPFNVSPYIRNLPLNQHPSAEKLAYCLENGIILGENQTFVSGYTKGMDL